MLTNKRLFLERDPLDITSADLAQLQESQNIEFVVEDDDDNDQEGKYFKIFIIQKRIYYFVSIN